MRARYLALALVCLVSSTAAAGAPKVDLALALAVDVSSSVDAQEDALQWAGYRAAFLDRRVADVIAGGRAGRIAVMVLEFGGPHEQRVTLGWHLIADAADARALSAAISAHSRGRAMTGGTALGAALQRAGALLRTCPCDPERRVIDVSGDGENNRGPAPDQVRNYLLAAGVTVNGLPLSGGSDSPDLARYYEDHVIGGDGSFSVPVEDPAASRLPAAACTSIKRR